MSAPTPPVKNLEGSRGDAPGTITEARSFEYFTPAKRRATQYEDVTIDTQPDPHRHLDRGWPLAFANGHTIWDSRSTALKHDGWFDFRDPNELWERNYYQQGAGYERQIEDTVKVARFDRQPQRLAPEWVEYLRANMQQIAFYDQGIWLVVASTARAILSDSICHFTAFQAGFKQRQAQAIVLYAMDLEQDHGEFAMDAARQSWLDDAHWQPAREYVEKLNTIVDWSEVIVATSLLFESLVGTLLRRELFERGGAMNHDTVTPVVFQAAQMEQRQVQRFAAAFVEFVCDSEEHGEANRAQVQEWIDEWLPQARAVAESLEPLVSSLPNGIPFEEAMGRVEEELAATLESLGLRSRSEVTA